MKDFELEKNIDTNWTSLGTPVYKQYEGFSDADIKQQAEEEKENSAQTKKKITILSPVISLQFITCLIVLILSFLTSAFFSEKFTEIKDIFDKEIKASMFFDGRFDDINYSKMFSLNNDKV